MVNGTLSIDRNWVSVQLATEMEVDEKQVKAETALRS